MKHTKLIVTIGIGIALLAGFGCSNGKTNEARPLQQAKPQDIVETSAADVPSDSLEKEEPAEEQDVSLYERVETLLEAAPSMAEVTSTDALNGPFKLPANRDFVVAVASEPVIEWIERMGVNDLASSDNFCIGEDFQTPKTFREKILSQFNADDRVYMYAFAPNGAKNVGAGDYWDVTIIPNRMGYTSDEFDQADPTPEETKMLKEHERRIGIINGGIRTFAERNLPNFFQDHS